MIKKIVIEIADKEIELTLEQVRKLKRDLDQLLNETKLESIPFLPLQTLPYYQPTHPHQTWLSTT